MHGYYIVMDLTDSKNIRKKIDMQLEEFNKHFVMEEIVLCRKSNSIWTKLKSRLPFCSLGFDYNSLLDKMISPDFVYMRRVYADHAYVAFFRALKAKYPKCKVIVEIPTYPYDWDDFARKTTWMLYGKEVYHRRKLKKYVERFVTYSNDDKIFGVPTIKTCNGINVEKTAPIKPEQKEDDSINLITVAMFQRHHGYERLIQGLGKYYRRGGKRNILLHIVGKDYSAKKQLPKYKALARKFGLDKQVIFYGPLFGQELDAIFNRADIAVDSLGIYKIKCKSVSTLKTREYLSRGLPIVRAVKMEAGIAVDHPYCCSVPNNSSEIDIDKLIEFYELVYCNKERSSVIQEIREYALNNIDNSVTLKPVIDYIIH